MTVSSTTRKAGPFSGNGVTTSFPFVFKVFTTSDISVVRADTLGVESTLVLGTDYTVALNADQTATPGGTITLTAGALASGYTLAIVGGLSYSQGTQLPSGGAFNATTVESALDRITMLTQQLLERVTSAIKLPVTSSSSITTLPTPTAGALLGWNATGTSFANYDPSALATVITYGTTKADIFTGTGSQTAFTLTANPGLQANLDVSVGGVTQLPGTDFTWTSGTTVTFTSAPPSGAKILIRYAQALSVGAATTAGALVGGSAGAIPYQTSGASTGYSAAGTAGQLLVSGGTSAPTWTDATLLNVASATTATNATTQAITDSSTKIATTAFSQSLVATSAGMGAPQSIVFCPTSSGASSFLPSSSASLSLTTQNIASNAPLAVMGCMSGANSGGVSQTRLGITTANITWSGLTASTTNYLYVDISSTGALTPGFTTIAPNYQGTAVSPSTTNGVHTFVIPLMQMYVGVSGSFAGPVCRVFVGEAVTGTSTVTSTVAYMPGTSVQSTTVSTLPASGTSFTQTHNLGIVPRTAQIYLVNLTADGNYSPGDIVTLPFGSGGASNFMMHTPTLTNKTVGLRAFTNGSLIWNAQDKNTGSVFTLTLANWSYYVVVSRGW